ncbi:hypothetical protein ACFLWJ_00895 [Chloroflexota bacterium]
MAFKKGQRDLILAVFMTVVCVIMLGIVIYDSVTSPIDWERFALYVATIGFIASLAALFYSRWRESA